MPANTKFSAVPIPFINLKLTINIIPKLYTIYHPRNITDIPKQVMNTALLRKELPGELL
jgi:hypothetical protein